MKTARIGKPKLKVIGVDGVRLFYPKKRDAERLSREEVRYYQDLHKILDDVFQEAATEMNWTWCQLASNAGLAYQTVANLGDRKTKFPQFRTVQLMVRAVGWELMTKQVKSNKKIRLAKTG